MVFNLASDSVILTGGKVYCVIVYLIMGETSYLEQQNVLKK